MGLGLRARAEITPDKPALIAGDEILTFAEVDRRADRAARALSELSGGASRVAIALKNRIDFYDIVAGAARLGVEAVPVPWRSSAREVAYYVEDSHAAPLIVEDDAPVDGTHVTLTQWRALMAMCKDEPLDSDPDPIVIRNYTSGTTGRPKAVQRVARSRAQMLASIGRYLELFSVDGDDGVHLVCGPLYHTAPLAFSTQALQLGQTVVLMERFDARDFLDAIDAHRVTWTFVVPIHLRRILALPRDVLDGYDLTSLHRVLVAGAPCPVRVKEQAIETFPPGTVWEFYGTTEGRATVISPDEALQRPGSVGRAIEGITVRVLDADGRQCAPGDVGMVYMSPLDGVRFEYAGAPDKTEQAWRDGLFTVGDMGYTDEDGYLYLTDRAQDLIITGGANVYPAEVEATLAMHPGVEDAVVFGVPDDEWGESVRALVQLRAPAEPDELIAFCRENLAHYKCPRVIEVAAELPRDLNGKIRRRDVRDPYWEGRTRRI
ncbi:MAG TPA: AMP-binding protein [Actinomycetota bacterium]|nr:AMP-binding protein [Actinomycetota bacterium]